MCIDPVPAPWDCLGGPVAAWMWGLLLLLAVALGLDLGEPADD
jgi:hypothetical protein